MHENDYIIINNIIAIQQFIEDETIGTHVYKMKVYQ